jgi:hypothetical protein
MFVSLAIEGLYVSFLMQLLDRLSIRLEFIRFDDCETLLLHTHHYNNIANPELTNQVVRFVLFHVCSRLFFTCSWKTASSLFTSAVILPFFPPSHLTMLQTNEMGNGAISHQRRDIVHPKYPVGRHAAALKAGRSDRVILDRPVSHSMITARLASILCFPKHVAMIVVWYYIAKRMITLLG